MPRPFWSNGAHYLLATVVVRFSDPALALQFIEAEHQPRMAYALEGRKRINGVQVAGIRFKERPEMGRTFLLDTPGNRWPPAASGSIQPRGDSSDGAVDRVEDRDRAHSGRVCA